jgi:hypothetical protein
MRELSATAVAGDDVQDHARECPACAALLRADHELQRTARRFPSFPMSQELQRALSEPRESARARGSSTPARLATILAPLAVSLGFGLTWLARPDLSSHLLREFWVGVAALGAAIALCVHVYLHRGADGLGMPAWLRWSCVAAAIGGTLMFASLEAFHGPANPGLRPSFDCFILGCGVALAVGAASFATLRRSALTSPESAGALGGCVGGLAAVLFLHLHCAAVAGLHLQIVHALPLLLAILLGQKLGRRWLAA